VGEGVVDPRVEEIGRELEGRLGGGYWRYSCQYYPPSEPDEPHAFVCESDLGGTFNLDDLREVVRILARRGARLDFFEVEGGDGNVIVNIVFYFKR
jgi:hypothetical protein